MPFPQTFFFTDLMSKMNASRAWIGLNDLEQEGIFVNADGSPVSIRYTLNLKVERTILGKIN